MDAAQALLVGIEKEKSSYSFYKNASEQCRDSSGARLFSILADIELNHVRYLESLYSGLVSDGNWQMSDVESTPVCPIDLDRPDLFPCAPPEEQKCLTVEDDLEILDKAIKGESEARDFYRNLAENMDDTTGKTVFEYLVNEEIDHERILRESRGHLAETGSWGGKE